MNAQKINTTNLVLCAMFTALVAIGAFIQVPVPYMDYFTLQFLFVLLAGLLLGPRYGTIAVGCYVFLGLIGLPIFAGGGGIGYIFRPSFGYLIGFILAALVTGSISTRTSNTFRYRLLACLAGFLVTYAAGIAYKYLILNYYTDTPATLGVIFASCFPLDIPGDLVLSFLASAISIRLNKTASILRIQEN